MNQIESNMDKEVVNIIHPPKMELPQGNMAIDSPSYVLYNSSKWIDVHKKKGKMTFGKTYDHFWLRRLGL